MKDIRTAIVQITDTDIVCIEFKENVAVDIDDATEILDVVTSLCAGRKMLKLAIGNNVKSISREARKYFSADHTAEHTRACAVVVNSRVESVIGNFFLGLNKPPYPLKLFKDVGVAKEWLFANR